ncbi:MAG: hypothetical protein D6781_06095 [Verrucomicrobia bacterium]|nr:MAG: hypothetical protein D6781_06095 [Verrucomicrobiota bacterium]
MRRIKREYWGWALYDWANSAYAVSVLAVVFQLYFVDVLATRVDPSTGERVAGVEILGATIPGGSLWSWTVAASMALVVLLSPIVGAVADYGASKKRFLAVFCAVGAAATAGMVVLGPGMWGLGVLLFIVSNICFVCGNVVYNGLLTDVAESEADVGFLSSFGWGLGYAASFLMLLLNLVLITLKVPSEAWSVRVSLLCVGLWWALFAIPTFLWVRERGRPGAVPEGRSVLSIGFVQIVETLRRLPRYSQLLVFMAAFFLYNDGIQTIIAQAATFARLALEADLDAIIPAFLMIQFVAFFGSLLFIRVERRWGTRRALLAALAVWIALIGWALVMRTLTEFYVMAFFGGLVLGVSQSASRTLYALMIPRAKSAEFFSLYAIVGKVASLVGPVLFGVGVLFAPSFERLPVFNSMAGAVAPLLLMVVAGALLLLRVDVARGRAEIGADEG